MFEAYLEALAFLFQFNSLLMMTGAVLIGVTVGVIPGISGMIAVALMLPLLFRMPPEIALTFIIAIHAVTPTGGSITAILVNIPGTGPNAATLLDGYPMSQKGEGSRAIGAAVTASTVGGLIPCLLALATIPLVLPIIMAFKTGEMVALLVLAISLIGALTGPSVNKGLLSGALGVFIALVGYQSVTGVSRFTFGSLFLQEGINLIAIALGLFGLGELFHMTMTGQATIAVGQSPKLSDAFQGAKDVFHHKWLWLKSTIIGYAVGIIPALGGETAAFVAYGHAKQTSKHPEKFGTGIVEGVVAPESSNNAVAAGALLTTMAFGIPGSAFMAIMLGAFYMVGVVPGPRMLVDHLPLGLTLLLGLALANVIGGIICFFAAPYLAKVTTVHYDFLFPAILCLVFAGGFVARGSLVNLVPVILFGILGLLMSRHGFSRPALLLGFVLGKLLEDYTLLALQISGPLFFLTPISVTLYVIVIGSILYPWIRNRLKRRLAKA